MKDDGGAPKEKGNAAALTRPGCGVPSRVPCCHRLAQCLTTPACLLGTFLTLIFVVSAFLVTRIWLVPAIKDVVIETVTLQPNSSSSFIHPDVHITMKIYVYNLTTSVHPSTRQTYMKGVAKGPYVYTVKSWKTNVVWNDNSTVSYRLKESHNFQPNLSRGNDDDIFNTVNAPPFTSNTEAEEDMIFNRSGVGSTDERMYRLQSRTLKDILWGEERDGKQEDGFLQEYVGYELKGKLGKHQSAQKTSKREAESAVFNVYTGVSKIERLNEVYSYGYKRLQRDEPDGRRPLPKSGVADGDFFPPFLDSSKDLVMFYRQLKRNVLLKYAKPVTFKGEKMYRYVIPRRTADWTAATSLNGKSPHEQPSSSDHAKTFASPTTDDGNPKDFLLSSHEDNLFLVTSDYNSDDLPYAGVAPCHQHLDIHPVSGRTMRKRLCYHKKLHMSADSESQGPQKLISIPLAKIELFYEALPNDLSRDSSVSSILHTLALLLLLTQVLMLLLALVLLPEMVLLFRKLLWKSNSAAPSDAESDTK